MTIRDMQYRWTKKHMAKEDSVYDVSALSFIATYEELQDLEEKYEQGRTNKS